MKKTNFNKQRGASLLEMLGVLAVAGILLALAVSQFGKSNSNLQRQNIAREFKVNLERCRFDSVRRRATEDDADNMSRVVITSATSYNVMTDANLDGEIGSSETRTIDFSGRSDVKIIAPATSFPVTVWFNQRGHITTDGIGGSVTPLFTVCNGVCDTDTTITSENSNVISISPTGTITMLFGGDSIVAVSDPTVANYNTSADINRWVTLMPISYGATPTPTPVVSPSASASATPRECSLNEKPSTAGCTCSAPRTVKSNGKCQD